MQTADIIGLKAVIQLVEQSTHTKFIVRRFGDGSGVPVVYEATHTKSNKEAVKDFSTWGEAMQYGNKNNFQIYEIVLFSSDKEDSQEMNGRRRMKFTFAFALENSPYQRIEQPAQIQGEAVDIGQRIAAAVDLALTKREIEDLRKENAELREELEGNEENEPLSQFESILDRIEGLQERTTKKKLPVKEVEEITDNAAVSGIDTNTKIERIKKALQELAKYDDKLADDLEKLALLAKNNTSMFQMVINSLRNLKV